MNKLQYDSLSEKDKLFADLLMSIDANLKKLASTVVEEFERTSS
jgi:hypothetical protein